MDQDVGYRYPKGRRNQGSESSDRSERDVCGFTCLRCGAPSRCRDRPSLDSAPSPDPYGWLVDGLATVALTEPDEAVRIVKCAVRKAMMRMVMRGVEGEMVSMMTGWRG